MALSKEDLLGILQELGADDIELFKFYLRQKQQGPAMTHSGIPQSSLEKASRVDLVDLMTETYNQDLTHITATILYKLRKFALRQTLISRTLSSPVPTLSFGSVHSPQPVISNLPLVPGLWYFPPELLDFITYLSQSQEQMCQILSDLTQIQVHLQRRSEQSMAPTFTATFVLGAAVSFMSALFAPEFALAFASYHGLSAGAGIKYCQLLVQIQDRKDQSRAAELKRELEILLLRILFKLLPLWMSQVSDDAKALIQKTIKNIEVVLLTNFRSRPERGSEWILVLTEQGDSILNKLHMIKDKLCYSHHTL